MTSVSAAASDKCHRPVERYEGPPHRFNDERTTTDNRYQKMDPKAATSQPHGQDGQRTTYHGICHCALVRYTVTLDQPLAPEGSGKINHCNCSICTKNGYLLVYPKREDVIFQDGCDSKMKSYFFGKKEKAHRFCGECGSSVLIDFGNASVEKQRPYLAMNVRVAILRETRPDS